MELAMSASATVDRHFPAGQESLPRLAIGVVIGLCAAKLLLHLFTSVRHYGYFRDELYYLDMARHLDWGYVDAAPLGAVYAKLALLMGGSLAALRILPALAGATLIALSLLIAREFGGGRFAQFLTGLVILMCPAVLVMDSLLTMNAFEPLFWMAGVLVIARILRTGNSRLWPWFGVFAGLGLENKHSTLFFGFAITVALLLTRYRREFLEPWIWIAGAIAVVLFLPNLVWQLHRHFPTLEDLENVRREGKNVVLVPLAFVKAQIIGNHPILFPVWLTGLIWLLWEKRWRVLGLTFMIFFVTMEIEHAKDYYLLPMYPMLFAAGGVAIERWLAERASWIRVAVVAVILIGTLITLPIATWMLSPEGYIAYAKKLGFTPPKEEVNHTGPLPQAIGDQFGWREMAREVGGIYNSLPPEERAKTAIIAGNYGEAGAIDMFGPQYGLPRAYSGHQNHFYWGPPSEQYENFIVIQWGRRSVQQHCKSFEQFEHYHPFGMGEENRPIYLCRGADFTIQSIWPRLKHWN
jgi:Dolichyl-phosphate-mannose-protein mannosyltransferase